MTLMLSALLLLLSGCSSAPQIDTEPPLPPELASFPDNVRRTGTPAAIDEQLFFASRGLYMNTIGQLDTFSDADRQSCGGMALR